MAHILKIQSIHKITLDVLQIRLEKPQGIAFAPGQAADVSINIKDWEQEKRPFTFTCLPDDDFLEFTIKTYPGHKGVTNQLLQLTEGDELIIHDVFGNISYKGEGLFIAGGAGVTPFLSIFRYLEAQNQIGNNQLLFANKAKADIIQEAYFTKLLGKNFINVLSDENVQGYFNGFVTEIILSNLIVAGNNKKIYLCGPPPMMNAIKKMLAHLDIDKDNIIEEGF